MRKTKGGESNGVRWGIFLTVVGILLGLVVSFLITWVGAEREIHKLLLELAAHKENVIALTKALDQHLPTGSNEWEKYHDEHPVQFYVTDHLGRALAGTAVLVVRSGEQVVTNNGGLTSTLWMSLGDKVSLNKNSFQPKEVVLDRENIGNRVISIKLRRIEHGKEKIAKK